MTISSLLMFGTRLAGAALAMVAPHAGGITTDAQPAVVGPIVVDVPLDPMPTVAAPLWATDPACNEWCRQIHLAYEAKDRGDLRAVVHHATAAYGLDAGWESWFADTVIPCESTWDPWADNGGHAGLTQQSKVYWPTRSAAAGFPGGNWYDPVANVATAAWMISAGYPTSHWDCA